MSCEECGMKPGVIVFSVWMALYIVALSVATTVHAMRLRPNCRISPEIEEAYRYAKTNSLPFIDGILEIPLAFHFGNRWFVGFLSSVFVVYIYSSVCIFIIYDATANIVTASLLMGLTAYRITTDICEYHVCTRDLKPLNEDLNVEEAI
jgi:hypothetical protein